MYTEGDFYFNGINWLIIIKKIAVRQKVHYLCEQKKQKMKQIDDITWQSNDGLITFKNMDCNEFMAGCKENEFDLNLSDPPYGIGMSNSNKRTKPSRPNSYTKYADFRYKEANWDDKVPDRNVFDNIFRTCEP